MEDTLSVKSNESLATSEEYDFVGDKPGASKTPTLDFTGGLSELKDALREPDSNMNDVVDQGKRIGHSVFYGSPVDIGKDPLSVELSPVEKQDSMKPDSSSDEETSISDVDQECTIFAGVTYLGAAQINAPKSEAEIHRNMAILNEQSQEQGIKVSISVPVSSQGIVVLYDASTNSVISRYEVHRILFYARGSAESSEASCFAFTWSHGESQESAIFQCHVFRCDIVEAVSRVSACFAKAFQRVPRSMSSSVTSTTVDLMSGSITTLPEARTLMYVFEVNLEIKEEDGKGSYSAVGKDKNGFRIKTNLEKQLSISIKQVSDNGPHLYIERCFGVLVAAGRHVKHSDMQLLEMKEQSSSTASNERNCTNISATWDPTEASFEALNSETPKDTKQYMTVAVDLVVRGIQEPVRFLIETTVRVSEQSERNFWYFQRKSLTQQFFLNLKENEDIHVIGFSASDTIYEDRNLTNISASLSTYSSCSASSLIKLSAPNRELTEQREIIENICSALSERNNNLDEFDIFGMNIAHKFRRITEEQRTYAEYLMNKILLYAVQNKLNDHSDVVLLLNNNCINTASDVSQNNTVPLMLNRDGVSHSQYPASQPYIHQNMKCEYPNYEPFSPLLKESINTSKNQESILEIVEAELAKLIQLN